MTAPEGEPNAKPQFAVIPVGRRKSTAALRTSLAPPIYPFLDRFYKDIYEKIKKIIKKFKKLLQSGKKCDILLNKKEARERAKVLS